MAKHRFHIVVKEVRGSGVRNTFIFTRQPVRPGTVEDAMYDAVKQQYEHMSYDGRFIVHGIDKRPDFVIMWATQARRACIIFPQEV